jgi:capsular polysaccharide biosynthesis protein
MSIKIFLQSKFKKISYFLFSFIYPKIKKSINVEEDSRIEVNKIFQEDGLMYEVFTIPNGRLYTDTIHDTAVILEDRLIKEASFQLRDNKNSASNNNIVFSKGTSRLQKKIKGTVLSLLTGGGGNNNYWHWLFDVLPRIELSKLRKNSEYVTHYLFPNLETKFQRETLDLLEIKKDQRLSSKIFRHIAADKLIITSHPHVLNDVDEKNETIPVWIIKFLQNSFLKKIKSKSFPKKIYIDRKDSKFNLKQTRAINNEEEVVNCLNKKGFKKISLSEHSFIDQVSIFNNADIIAGLHGSGFSNIVFSKKGVKVLEFKSEKTGNVIKNLAKNCKLNHISIVGDLIKPAPNQQGLINININSLTDKIN